MNHIIFFFGMYKINYFLGILYSKILKLKILYYTSVLFHVCSAHLKSKYGGKSTNWRIIVTKIRVFTVTKIQNGKCSNH